MTNPIPEGQPTHHKIKNLTELPEGMIEDLANINGYLGDTLEGVQSGDETPEALTDFMATFGMYETALTTAKSLNLPPDVMNQLNAVQQDLINVAKNGQFTPNAESALNDAVNILDKLVSD